jgi:translation initiation factor 5B
VFGVEVVEGVVRMGTPICVPSKGGINLGRISCIEVDHVRRQTARAGDKVSVEISASRPDEASRLYGRHFDFHDPLVSRITRKSIDVLKNLFREELTKDDWRLVVKLKKTFHIE